MNPFRAMFLRVCAIAPFLVTTVAIGANVARHAQSNPRLWPVGIVFLMAMLSYYSALQNYQMLIQGRFFGRNFSIIYQEEAPKRFLLMLLANVAMYTHFTVALLLI